MNTTGLFAVFAVVLVAIAGCAPGRGAGAPSTPRPAGSLVGSWTVTKLSGREVRELLAEGGRAPTLAVAADGGFSGFSGVNRYSGTADAAGLSRGVFDAGPIVATKMAGRPEAMAVEQAMFKALNAGKTFAVEGDGATLSTDDGVVVMELTRGT
jgi:heat shock protein HslJ